MKKILLPLAGMLLLCLKPAFAVEKKEASYDKFYGKIVGINQNNQSLTVHNKKGKLDATFKWDQETGMTYQKKAIPSADLKVGQSLIVSYVTDSDGYKAKKITVRSAFSRKKETQSLFQ